MDTKKPSRPLYRQVVDALRQDIVQGTFAVGQNLPTESELAERFDLSRHTIREALRELRTSGLVTSRRGSGTTVAAQDTAQYYLHETGSLDDISQYATSTRWQVEVRFEAIAKSLAAKLSSKAGQRWMCLEGCRYAKTSNEPVYWTQAWIHDDFAGIARLLDRRTAPIYELIEDMYGVRVGEVDQVVRGGKAPQAAADSLGLPRNAPVIELERTYRLTDGKVVEVSRNYYPIDHFSLALKLRRRTA